MVQVTINRESFVLPKSGSLADVLAVLGIDRPDGIAIAVNENVISRGEWDRYEVMPFDKIFVIRATQGG